MFAGPAASNGAPPHGQDASRSPSPGAMAGPLPHGRAAESPRHLVSQAKGGAAGTPQPVHAVADAGLIPSRAQAACSASRREAEAETRHPLLLERSSSMRTAGSFSLFRRLLSCRRRPEAFPGGGTHPAPRLPDFRSQARTRWLDGRVLCGDTRSRASGAQTRVPSLRSPGPRSPPGASGHACGRSEPTQVSSRAGSRAATRADRATRHVAEP